MYSRKFHSNELIIRSCLISVNLSRYTVVFFILRHIFYLIFRANTIFRFPNIYKNFFLVIDVCKMWPNIIFLHIFQKTTYHVSLIHLFCKAIDLWNNFLSLIFGWLIKYSNLVIIFNSLLQFCSWNFQDINI